LQTGEHWLDRNAVNHHWIALTKKRRDVLTRRLLFGSIDKASMYQRVLWGTIFPGSAAG
jgi:hypothetical protein